ncbi:TPA: hypothetical protein H5X26_004990 [Escherichia coli]|nr:hypothetical protein [Escherichia coli]
MTSQALQRHEIVFSMAHDSMSRVQELLKRCGHGNLNLLLARGLALVEFVLDQAELGRVVGSVILGEEEFLPLRERPELLKPMRAGKPPAEPEDNVAQSMPEAAVATINPKLMPRAKVPVEDFPEAPLPRARRLFKHAAFAVNDDAGPVRSLAFHQERCDSMGIEPPLSYNGHALPGELRLHHLDDLQRVMDTESMATHFYLCPATDDLSFYGYFPNTGWHRMNPETGEWAPESIVQAGELSLFPMDLAALYLRRHGHDLPERQLLEA